MSALALRETAPRATKTNDSHDWSLNADRSPGDALGRLLLIARFFSCLGIETRLPIGGGF